MSLNVHKRGLLEVAMAPNNKEKEKLFKQLVEIGASMKTDEK